MLFRPAHGLLLAAVLGLAACSTDDWPVIGKPAASFDGGSIKMSDYKLRLKVLQENYKKQTASQGEAKFPSLDSPAGRSSETTLETESAQDLVDAVLIQRQAQNRGINITEDDINAQVDPFRKNYDTQAATERAQGKTTKSFNDYLNSLGYSLDRLREEVRTRLYEQRLEDKLAQARKTAALTAIKSNQDIGAVAKQYSDDVASAGSGGGLSIHGKDLVNVPGLKPAIDALQQPGATSADFVRADDGFYYFKLASRDAAADLIKMQYVYIYDPKPELYSTTRRPKWLIDMIAQIEKQAHVKYNVGSKAT
jgi:predicted chitinase